MRYLSADVIFPIHKPLIINGILIIDENGIIIDLLDPAIDEISDSLPVEKFEGILCPGFVNAHCHLELSHLKGKFAQGKGLPYFIKEIITNRDAKEEEILQAITWADAEMYESGIVAVGDISNSATTLTQKRSSKIYYHTFVEIFDISSDRAAETFDKGKILQHIFLEAGQNASISPHATYSVSQSLLKLISDYVEKSGSLLSIHNQETESENEMFVRGTGALFERLRQQTNAFSDWKPEGKTSLSTLIGILNLNSPMQLVHNTFTGINDIRLALSNQRNFYWCLCVNANLFIENTLPDIRLLSQEGCKITVGTDSYASNTSLSVLDELKTINNNYPEIDLAEILKWATLNGSDFLKQEKKYGSFEIGKMPGINNITKIGKEDLRLNSASRLIKIY